MARQGQEGSRWINARPTGEEVAAWFEENVKLHEGLEHKDYLPGITMIQSTEKSKDVTGFDGDAPIITESQNLVFTPYPRVDIRVRYWQDYLELHRESMLGVIERIAPPEPRPDLPEGFFRMDVAGANNTVTRFVCCSVRARIYKRESVSWETTTLETRTVERQITEQRRAMSGEVLLDAPPATKMIPVLGRYGADPFSLMKAETGAVGRALGLAGMLVVPGAGVATAEDLLEAQQMSSGEGETAAPAAAPAEGQAPAQGTQEDEETLRKHALDLAKKLEDDFPERHKQIVEWARSRKLGPIGEMQTPALRGTIRKLERELDEANSEQPAS